MGKKTGKADKEPAMQALIPTHQLIAVRAFATANHISEGAALRALLDYALEHSEEIEWRLNMPHEMEVTSADPIQSTFDLSAPSACSATRGQFAPRRELPNAQSRNQVQ